MDEPSSSPISDPSLPSLRRLFSTPVWERAEGYVRQSRVNQLVIEPDPNAQPGWTIDATVIGTKTYGVWLDLGRDDSGQWMLASGCDCPVGLRCKHQAAVVLELNRIHPEIVPDKVPEGLVSPPPAPEPVSLPLLGATSLAAKPESDDEAPAGSPATSETAASEGEAEEEEEDDAQAEQALNDAVNRLLALTVLRPTSAAGTAASDAAHPALGTLPTPGSNLRRAPRVAPAQTLSPLDQAARRWLEGLRGQHRAQRQEALAQSAVSDEMVFFELGELPARYQHGAQLTLIPARATRLKKSGQPGKLRPCAPSLRYEITQSADNELRSLVADLDVMARVTTGAAWDSVAWGTLVGPLVAITLPRALATGRVVDRLADGSPSEPWQWGEARSLDWQWEAQDKRANAETTWKLLPLIRKGDGSPSSAQPFVSGVCLYRDRVDRSVGPLSLEGLAPELVDRLMDAPPMRESWLSTQPDLRPLLPSLPASVAEPVARRIRGEPARPVLRLEAGTSSQGGSQAWLMLEYDYQGVRQSEPLEPGAMAEFISTPTGLVELHRDAESEHRAAMALARLATPAMASDPRAPANRWLPLGLHPADRRALLAQWLTDDFAELRAEGFLIEFGPEWKARSHSVETISADLAPGTHGLSGQPRPGWLDLSLGFTLDGRRINLLPLVPQLVAGFKPARDGLQAMRELPDRLWAMDDDGQWWGLPAEPLRPWLEALLELVGERHHDFTAERLRLSPIDALRLGADHADFGANGHVALRDLLATRAAETPLPPTPEGLCATPRPYQSQGAAWLGALARHHLGGVLADDMGLGKTLQAITYLLGEKNDGRLQQPALVVAPTSLMGNWRRECERFAPSLRVLVLHGHQRHEQFDTIGEHDVVLTTYALLHRDIEPLARREWQALILDEAQALKNASTHAAQAARRIRAKHRIALTGTPMENHLGELWSLFDLVLPGYLGREARFTTLFRNPIEKGNDQRRMALLRRRLAPFMLRRDKTMVASELPPKIEQVVRVQLSPAQANLYETIRVSTESRVQEALASKGLARSQITVLDALLKLRQACCDPRLVPIASAKQIRESAKLDWLMQTLPEMLEEGRRVLLFSQFTSMLALIEERLARAKLRWTKLTGQSQNRDQIVSRFTTGEVPLFLISLKAGGVGLNLPQADTVIHFDPWWNPAVENQATDRAHRLGQTQTVFVYKLVAEGTLEERILGMQARKGELARGVRGDVPEGEAPVALSENDVNWLLQPLGAAAQADAETVAADPALEAEAAESAARLILPQSLLDLPKAPTGRRRSPRRPKPQGGSNPGADMDAISPLGNGSGPSGPNLRKRGRRGADEAAGNPAPTRAGNPADTAPHGEKPSRGPRKEPRPPRRASPAPSAEPAKEVVVRAPRRRRIQEVPS